ncbi:hypothetical protein QTH91_09690 [Variovorax dokdonensis]|uniref:Uncharacterized protein n=1 Tax=Variovorax dokdonensis TaxID=344883 RepID=A0ABT7N9Y7_9BURK|nr:hypothetical protein [Variovorax dokdonensis]MDM0044753.1 hypothetical protein [Variovorax dokdonensis]
MHTADRPAARSRLAAALAWVAPVLLAGCAGQMQLLENGRTYPGSYNGVSGTAEAFIDGERYTGTYSNPPPISLGIGVGGGSWGGGFGGVGVSTGTGYGGGRALLRSPDGQRIVECYFATSFGSGQGECMSQDGRRFILVIGG